MPQYVHERMAQISIVGVAANVMDMVQLNEMVVSTKAGCEMRGVTDEVVPGNLTSPVKIDPGWIGAH